MQVSESDRLRLREISEFDAGFYLEMLQDDQYKANIADRGVRTKEQALACMRERIFSSYDNHGFGMYLVERSSDAEPVGLAGLVKRDFLSNVDLGYAFLPCGRGQGFATEAASACIDLAAARFAIRQLSAITGEHNNASIAVLQRLGFRSAGTVCFPADGERCAHYLLDIPTARAGKWRAVSTSPRR